MGMWQAYAKCDLILCKPFAWPWAYYILALKTKNIRTPRISILTAGLAPYVIYASRNCASLPQPTHGSMVYSEMNQGY